MNELTLTPKEIESITGYTRAADQQKWFEDNKIPCYPSRNGLVVARAWFERAPFENRAPVTMPASGSKPNFGAMDKAS